MPCPSVVSEIFPCFSQQFPVHCLLWCVYHWLMNLVVTSQFTLGYSVHAQAVHAVLHPDSKPNQPSISPALPLVVSHFSIARSGVCTRASTRVRVGFPGRLPTRPQSPPPCRISHGYLPRRQENLSSHEAGLCGICRLAPLQGGGTGSFGSAQPASQTASVQVTRFSSSRDLFPMQYQDIFTGDTVVGGAYARIGRRK